MRIIWLQSYTKEQRVPFCTFLHKCLNLNNNAFHNFLRVKLGSVGGLFNRDSLVSKSKSKMRIQQLKPKLIRKLRRYAKIKIRKLKGELISKIILNISDATYWLSIFISANDLPSE